MTTDAEKIEEIGQILETQNRADSFEIVSLALSIKDEEEREFYLLETVYWLIRNETWQKAYGTAQLMSETYEKAEALRSVADYAASAGHLEKAFSVYDEAEKAALTENLAEWQQAELLHRTAQSLRRIGAIHKADEIWRKAVSVAQKGENSNSQNGSDSSSVLAEIAEHFAAEKQIERALEIARNIKNVGKKERALRRISEHSQNIKRVA